MPNNTPEGNTTESQKEESDKQSTTDAQQHIHLKVTVPLPEETASDVTVDSELAKEYALEKLKDHPEDIKTLEITGQKDTQETQDDVHVIKDETGRVWFIRAESCKEAGQKLREEFPEPVGNDTHIFVEGTLEEYNTLEQDQPIAVIE
jgi:hypothetical protein